ncbi:unnamed protein product [Urochloa humidicola]
MAPTAEPRRMPTGCVILDNDASETSTVIRVGRGAKIWPVDTETVISCLNLVVRNAYMVIPSGDNDAGGDGLEVFHVTDEEGNKVLDEAAISSIQQALEFGSSELEEKIEAIMVAHAMERSSKKIVDMFSFGDVTFSVSTSPKGGFDIKFGSTTLVHLPKQCSVRHPVVQMMLLDTSFSYGDSFGRPSSLVAKAIIHIIKKLRSISCATDVSSVFQAGWVAPKKHTAKSSNREACALAVAPSLTPGHGNWTPVLWLDSGAAHHVVGDARILINLRDPPAGSAEAVIVADGFNLPVVKVGDIWTERFRIEDVYLVPGLQMNLVSVRQLARRRIFSTFRENHADLKRGHEQVGGAIADEDTSLYRLHFLKAI